jgi:FkbM family methyltransferase
MNYFKSLIEVLNNPMNKGNKLKALLKIIWWKCNQLFFHIPAIVQLTPEAQCICHPESSFGGLVIYTRFPEYHDMNFIYNLVKTDDIFFDVGANIGTYSLLAASKITNGKIYAFEPVLLNIDKLSQNIKLNNFDNRIEIIEKVVTDSNGIEPFVSCEITEISHISHLNGFKEEKHLMLPSVKLDTFAKENGVSYVETLKIDVEGAEYKVLEGFNEYLTEGNVGVLLIELSPKAKFFGIEPTKVFTFLIQRNYNLYTFNRSNRLDLMDVDTFRLSRTKNNNKVKLVNLKIYNLASSRYFI